MSVTLNRVRMMQHAKEWIAAWNRRDLRAVLDAFHEDASFRSPRAIPITGAPLVQGKPAMEQYWRAGLARLHTLDFTLLDVVCDVEAQAMLVHYLAHLNGTTLRACELFRFEGGRKIYAEALYGDADMPADAPEAAAAPA
jgi:ketosteroid isomerase-like protein